MRHPAAEDPWQGLGGSATDGHRTGAKTDPTDGASFIFNTSVTFSASALIANDEQIPIR
jgi:hypothetical protein